MKKSSYNYIVKKANRTYCFNAITRLFFRIPEKGEDLLKTILDSPDQCKNRLPDFYKKLIQGNFIIDDDINEIDIIREKNKEACNSKKYSLTILPTIDCNFRCWYCYEKHVPCAMSEDVIKKTKKYIENILYNEEVEHFSIDWFGGEPFLYFQSVIKPVDTN